MDVSKMVEIHIADPAPKLLHEAQKPGFLYRYEDGTIFVWSHQGDVGAYVCVAGSQVDLGSVQSEVDPQKLLCLGRAVLRGIEKD